MADDLKELRDQFQSDLEDWQDARDERAIDMRYLSGHPFSDDDEKARADAKRPLVVADELSQYVNQIVNEVRANPRAVQFAPTGPGTSEDVADFYADKMREIEYRSHAQLAYTTAFENAVTGGYGFVRVSSEFQTDSVDQQELIIMPVANPNTVIPNWNFQRPDLSDMRRCFVLEHRPIETFKQDFPKAKIQDFDGYEKDQEYSLWVQEDRILLAEYWCVHQEKVKLLLVQLPTVQPPSGVYGFRPAQAPPPITIQEKDWATMPPGSTVIQSREATKPRVVQQLVNGVEILSETHWPGKYIPIAGCMGRTLYLDDGGTSQRVLMSAGRLARDPYLAYCFYRTCEMENVGMTTKNPYWAYEGQVDANQQNEIAKSLHEPVAVLFAKAVTEATGQQLLPLPQRNISEPAIQALSIGAEEMRRAIQSAFATNFLPTAAQRNNEKSGVALEKIDQARLKGSFHFVDHFEMMLRQVGCICQEAMDTFYDTERQVLVRHADDTTEHLWVNSRKEGAVASLKGDYAVTVSSGPSVDSTREAASQFADTLLQAEPLMQLLGPQKAAKIAALAIKLKVKQTGIGAIGEQIVDIISPPDDGKGPSPEQLQQQLGEAKQLLDMAQKEIQQRDQALQTKQVEQQGKLQITQLQEAADSQRNRENNETKLAVAELGAKVDRLALFMEERARLGTQAHDMGLAAADAAHEKDLAATSALTTLAGRANEPSPNGNGAGA